MKPRFNIPKAVFEPRARPRPANLEPEGEGWHSWFSCGVPGGHSCWERFSVEVNPIFERRLISIDIGPALDGLILILGLDQAKSLALELASAISAYTDYFKFKCPSARESCSVHCRSLEAFAEPEYRRSQIRRLEASVTFKQAAIHLRGLAHNDDSLDVFLSIERASALLYDLERLVRSVEQST